jgi:hypothetical protein
MAGPSNTPNIPTKEIDYLDQDPPIRGQKYACISFVSPEDVIARKDVFMLGKFMNGIATDVSTCLDNLSTLLGNDPSIAESVRLIKERHSYLWSPNDMQAEFNAYRAAKEIDVDREFRETMGVFTTSIRGFKIRGVYDNIEEAKVRARSIKKFDDKFHVFISEIGCWCPWSPNPEDIADFEYSETQLNTLMSNYMKAQGTKDELYNARKTELIDKINTDRDLWLEKHVSDVKISELPGDTDPSSTSPIEITPIDNTNETQEEFEPIAQEEFEPIVQEEFEESQKVVDV